jgi:HlyD family secretion protein
MVSPVRGKIGWSIVGILFIAAGAMWWWRAQASRGPAPKFVSVPVEKGRLIARVTATGTLSALVTVQVGSQVSGRIAQISVDFNSPVKKGQVIAKIDPQLFYAAVEQAKANYLSADAQLTKAKVQAVDAQRQFDRSKALRDQKLIAQADLDTAQANADSAKAQVGAADSAVAQAKATLHQAEINLEYTTIISPTNGVVISRAIDVGQTVAASFQSPTLFTIAEDLKKMQVDTSVAEADVGKLRPDMPATFTVDAYPTERFKGKVRQIRNAPQTVQNVVTYDAVIDVDNSELKLKPGMTANVTFIYAEKDDVLKVPNAALRFRPPATMLDVDGGAPRHVKKSHDTPADQRTVWVLRDGKAQSVDIRIGVSDGSVTELVDGLHVGDQVITEATGDAAKGPSPSAQPFRGRPF